MIRKVICDKLTYRSLKLLSQLGCLSQVTTPSLFLEQVTSVERFVVLHLSLHVESK